MISINNLIKKYDNFILDIKELELSKGEILGVIGKNGAGKTTLIKSILNLIQINDGSVKIGGTEISKDRKYILQKIGYISDKLYYYEDLSIEQTKNFIKPFYKEWDDERFFYFIKKFNLSDCLKYKIKNLSRGMGTKFSLAIAFAYHPELYVLDEPTSGLDPHVRGELLEVLKDFTISESSSILFSTHIIEDIEDIADTVVFIDNGKVIFKNRLKDLKRKNPRKRLNSILKKYYKSEDNV